MIVIVIVCVALFAIDLLFLTWLRMQLDYIQTQIDENVKDSALLLEENKRLKEQVLKIGIADKTIRHDAARVLYHYQ